MGIVLNRPLPEIDFTDLLGQLGIDASDRARQVPVHFGGPVEPGRGFVLHRVAADENVDEEGGLLRIGAEGLAMTTTRDILEDIAHGRGPDRAVLSLGYAGWGPGQLESEIEANAWLSVSPDEALLFGEAHDAKWRQAFAKLRVDPLLLSVAAGHA